MRPASVLGLVLVAFIACQGCVPETDMAGCLRDCNGDLFECVELANDDCRNCQLDSHGDAEYSACAPRCIRSNVNCVNDCLACIADCAQEVEDKL